MYEDCYYYEEDSRATLVFEDCSCDYNYICVKCKERW